ncbi:unnamed protein product [Anisakis simplex]|uniref:Symplekin (inferred by orthology to a human protein) n=1 Tax=Anisakis simplex TaxID=6269 RepID=A0A0M3KDT5_ANISI|nr:unnamed protein product [Anisakis simplex]
MYLLIALPSQSSIYYFYTHHFIITRCSYENHFQIGNEIHEALQMSGKTVDQRITHLQKAQELLLNHDRSGSLLDNFLDEMLEFVVENDAKMRCFVGSFIEKACKKDAEVMKKAVVSLSYMMELGVAGCVKVTKKVHSFIEFDVHSARIFVRISRLMHMKTLNKKMCSCLLKVIAVCTQVYAYVLKWAAASRSVEVERCWEAFCVLKGRIMQQIDSDNEGCIHFISIF